MKKQIKLGLFTSALLVSNLVANDFASATVYSATKSEQSIKDVTSNVEVITGAELEERHVSTVLDALRLSGISLTQNGSIGQSSSIFMNGMSSGNLLVMVDGIKYNDPTGTEGQAQLEHIMVNDIERIEIISGAQSGVWGANAVSGVINIITKEASKDLRVNTTIEYGTNNTKKVSASASQKKDKLSYYVGINYLKSDGISAQTPAGEDPSKYEDDGYENKTINAKFGYELSDSDELKFNVTDLDAEVEYDGCDKTWPATCTDVEKANLDTRKIYQNNRLYKLVLDHKLNTTDYVNVSYSKTSFDKKDPLGYTSQYKAYNNEYSIDSKVVYDVKSFLLAGINKQESKDEINNRTIKSKGAYITNSNKFDKVIFTQSLRKDFYDLFDDKTTGKLGIKYNFNKSFSLSSNYGTAYKAPSLSQLYGYGGNTSLVPETTKSLDFNLKYRNINFTYFDNEVTDLIEYVSAYTQVAGTSKFKGYKISYNHTLDEDTLIGFNYLNQSAKDKDGNDLHRRIQESAKLTLDYYGFENIHLATDIQYIGDRFNDAANTVQTGKYTLVNIVANYDVDNDTSVYCKVNNLTDRLYQEVDGYATNGRTITAGLKVKF